MRPFQILPAWAEQTLFISRCLKRFEEKTSFNCRMRQADTTSKTTSKTSRDAFVVSSNPFEFSEANAEDWLTDDIKRRQEVAKRSRIKGNRNRLAAVQNEAAKIKAELEDISSFSQENQLPRNSTIDFTAAANQCKIIAQKRKHIPVSTLYLDAVSNTLYSRKNKKWNNPQRKKEQRRGERFPTQ